MSKHIQGFLMLLLLFIISGCGGGATSGDPLGTDSITVEASATSVSAGQESIITATVVRLNKLPATDRSVSFSFRTNNTGGTLRVVNEQVDGQNKAIAVYTAGSNSPLNDVTDTIQVSLSNDAAAVIVITRSGTGRIVKIFSLTANPTALSANQSSVITASIRDNNNNPVSGDMVTFSIPMKNSGSPTLTSFSGVSDSNGIVTTVYSPGIASPANSVDDTVQASLADGSSRAVVITRKGTIIFKIFTLAADPSTPISADQSSVITASIRDNNNNPISGETVSFSIPVRNTGSPTLTSFSGVSDSNGIVTTVYSPGVASPANSVDDTVQASLVDGSSRAVVITRTGKSVTPLSITVVANPNSLSAGQVSIVTATVTGDNNVGVAVTFTLLINNSVASLTSPSGTGVTVTTTTDGSGRAVVIYRPGTNTPAIDVQDTVQAVVGSASSAATITRKASMPTTYVFTVTSSPSTLPARAGTSAVTANVKDNLGNAYTGGASVSFTVTTAQFGLATVTSPATTDGNGNAIATYTSNHTIATSDIVTATTTIAGVTYTGATTITVP